MNSIPTLDTFESALLADSPRGRRAPRGPTRPQSRTPASAAGGRSRGDGGGCLGGGRVRPRRDRRLAGVRRRREQRRRRHRHRPQTADAAGLEQALQAKGVDADVSYDGNGFGSTVELGADGKPLGGLQPPVGSPPGLALPGGGAQQHTEVQEEGGTDTSGPTRSGPGAGDDDPCGLGTDPATLTRQGDDWVLTIPADSPLQDRHVEIGTDAQGALSVAYAGDEAGSMCGMVTMKGTPPA